MTDSYGIVSTPHLILASASPRRRELLAALGVPFEVVTSEVRELDSASAPHLTPAELATANAQLKAAAVAVSNPGRWVLGADTVVSLGKRLLGKPATLIEARDFLRALSGRVHEVVTGCVLLGPEGETDFFHEISRVKFQALSEEIISRYLAEVPVLDKAGAYAIQHRREWIIEEVDGPCDNVIGLPTARLAEILRSRGLL